MSKPKILFLTTVSTEINEKGQERLKKVNKKQQEIDEDNPPPHSAQWYRNLGVEPPIEETEDEVSPDGYVKLQEDEYEYIHNEVILERQDFSFAIDSETEGITTVYTKSGLSFDVMETTDDIYGQLFLADQSWWEEKLESLKWKFKRLFKKKEKDLILEFPSNEE